MGYAQKNLFLDNLGKLSAMVMNSGIGDINKGHYENA
jgi:hypothetical protein